MRLTRKPGLKRQTANHKQATTNAPHVPQRIATYLCVCTPNLQQLEHLSCGRARVFAGSLHFTSHSILAFRRMPYPEECAKVHSTGTARGGTLESLQVLYRRVLPRGQGFLLGLDCLGITPILGLSRGQRVENRWIFSTADLFSPFRERQGFRAIA